jgi:hypothetical protein
VKAALFILFACAAVSLFARGAALPDSTSPDHRYRVTVTEVSGRIAYHLTEAERGKSVLSLRSSYQPDRGSGDWAFQQSLGATVYWRKDSQSVAIEEANYRTIGTVLIARRTPQGFRRVPLDADALMRESKMPWERGRPFFGAWGTRGTFTVGLNGLIWADPEFTPPEKRRRKEASCGFTVALASGDVVSIDH